MKKRIISFILAVIMIVGMLPLGAITAFAEEEVQYPIVVSGNATYSDCTFDLSGKTVSHLFEFRASYSSTLTFRNVTFKNVSATGNGGCVYIEGRDILVIPKVHFINCTFINCSTTGHGGVIYSKNDGYNIQITVENCTVKNCSANGYGGFMYGGFMNKYYYTPEDSIKDTTFVDCHAKYGGAVYYENTVCSAPFSIQNCTASSCSASEDGGFMYVNGDTNALINNSEFSDCTAKNGGFLFVNQYGANMSITNSEIFDCKATDGDGGAIYCYGETLNMENSVIRTCTASRYGGGLYIPERNTNAAINKDMKAGAYTLISGCSAEYGGGAYAADMKLMQNVIFADNKSKYDGGGMYNYTCGDGSTTNNCRFYRNIAGDDSGNKRWGGGLYIDDGSGWVEDCQFFENEAYKSGAELWADAKIKNCTFTVKDPTIFKTDGTSAIDVWDGADYRDECKFKSADDYAFTEGKGTGTEADPYIIESIDDWDALHYMVKRDDNPVRSGNFVLKNDIIAVNPIGQWISNSDKTKAFQGTFDGNGNTLNLYLAGGYSNNAAFNFTEGATVKNLTIKGYVKGDSAAGGIIGHAENTTVGNCKNYAEINGTDYVGGIIGWAKNTNITTCENYGNVNATRHYGGGIVGNIDGGKLLNCLSTGDVSVYDYGGGIVGYEKSAVIFQSCHTFGSVSATQGIGGITGHSASGSNYEQCFYDKEKAVGNSLGTGLSTNAMHGIAADESGNLMPYCVNDYIKENDKSKDGWLRAAFNKNGSPAFISDTAVMYIGADGLVNYTEDAKPVTDSMEKLGEKGEIYYVDGTVIRDGRIQILGNVTLILNDDCCYDVKGGIGLKKGNSLTVTSYSLGEHMGSMKAEANGKNKGAAAIGGNAATTAESLSEGTLSVSSEKYDCGDFTVYGGNIEAIAYSDSENDMYGVGIGGSSLSLQHSYIETNVYKSIDFKTGTETFNGGDGGNVKVYNGNLSVKATGAVGIGGGNGTYFYVKDEGIVYTNENFSGGNGGAFAYYGGTVTVESDVAAFGKGRNGGGGRDVVTDKNMTSFTLNKDTVNGVAVGDTLAGLNTIYDLNEAPNLNGEKCVKFNDWRKIALSALEPTCETAGHKAYVLRTADNRYYEDEWFTKKIGDASAFGAWLSEGGDGYIAPLGHIWVCDNNEQHKCLLCKNTQPHSGTADECEVCGKNIYYSYSTQAKTFEKKPMPDEIKPLASFDENYTLAGGWYVVRGNVTAAGRITCTGDVHLILENGCDFTAINGIALEEGVSLSVYAQSFDAEEMGKLTVPYSTQDCAGIGSNQDITCGNISIHGGVITVKSVDNAAGIGSGDSGSCGNISIYGGDITATAGWQAAGIGSGNFGSCDNISICGGDITATGGRLAAGIGSGNRGSCEDISICGGNITATGGKLAAGIGSGYNGSCESVAISDYLDITAGADKDSAKPVAVYKGEKYVHTELNTARKEPTCTQNGHIEFYKKDGKNYSDKDCTKEITDLTAWLNTTEKNGGGMISAMGHSDTNLDGKCDHCETVFTSEEIKCDGISLTLSSDIYINFYMQLTAEALANGKMVFTIGGRTVEGITATLNKENNRYYFACPLNALEMAETVKAEFTYGSTKYVQEYSVEKYVKAILGGDYTDEMKELARSIANYGYHAQYYLQSIHKNVTIGDDGYKEMLNYFKDNIDIEKAKELQDHFTASEDKTNLIFDGRTVYFDSATALNFYVITKDGEAPTATCDKGKTVEIKKYSGNTYIVSVKDITATELADTYTVTVSHGGDTMTLKGSVLDYCAAVINAHNVDNPTAKDTLAINAMAAFYDYYRAAVKYVTAASK